MTDSLHNLIAAQGDAVIPNLRYADLAAPTASYVIDKRSTRVPFLAPIYSANNVSVARAIIADPGFLIPGSVYLSAEVHNTDATVTHRLTPNPPRPSLYHGQPPVDRLSLRSPGARTPDCARRTAPGFAPR